MSGDCPRITVEGRAFVLPAHGATDERPSTEPRRPPDLPSGRAVGGGRGVPVDPATAGDPSALDGGPAGRDDSQGGLAAPDAAAGQRTHCPVRVEKLNDPGRSTVVMGQTRAGPQW